MLAFPKSVSNICGFGFTDVGYGTANTNPDGADKVKAQYPTFAFFFQPMADEDGWVSLGSVILNGLDAFNGDYIYQLRSSNATHAGSEYQYFDRENVIAMFKFYDVDYDDELVDACVGWWLGGFTGDPADKVDDVEFKVGSGFIGNIPAFQNIDIQCNGEAKNKASNVNVTGQLYPTFGNPVPRDIKLGELVVAGMDAFNGDYLYQLRSSNATHAGSEYQYFDRENVIAMFKFYDVDYDDELVDACVGWWLGGFTGDPADKIDDAVTIKTGESHIGKLEFGSLAGETTVISYPAAY